MTEEVTEVKKNTVDHRERFQNATLMQQLREAGDEFDSVVRIFGDAYELDLMLLDQGEPDHYVAFIEETGRFATITPNSPEDFQKTVRAPYGGAGLSAGTKHYSVTEHMVSHAEELTPDEFLRGLGKALLTTTPDRLPRARSVFERIQATVIRMSPLAPVDDWHDLFPVENKVGYPDW